MSSLLARIMLAIFMLPAAAIVHVVALIMVGEYRRNHYTQWYPRRVEWIAAGLIAWIFITAWWLLLWRCAVVWDGRRKRLTLWAVAGATILGGLAGLAARPVDTEFGYFVFTAVTPLVWLPLTVLIWRETKEERAARLSGIPRGAIVCPTCGYNLTGLSAARCPECGSTFTLDDLLAGQPGLMPAGSELEKP